MKTVETKRTATHMFWIVADHRQVGTFEVQFQPLNPKTGKPWQASHRVTHGADVKPHGWDRPIAFSTIEGARAAMAWKIDT